MEQFPGPDTKRDSVSLELERPRLLVSVGARGAFDAEKRLASEAGVETVDVLHAPRGIALSDISAMSKRSLEYSVCTGLAVVGHGPDGRNVSFMTHQFPTENPDFLRGYEELTRAKLDDFLTRIKPGALDVGFFGGERADAFDPDSPFAQRYRTKNRWYENSRELFSRVVRESAGRELRVVAGPNKEGEQTSAFLDTARGALYIERER